MDYLFPFESVKQNEKIVIYGAGNVCKSFLRQIEMTNYCEVIAVVDKQYEIIESCYNIKAPETIPELFYQKVLVAIDNRLTAEQIKKELMYTYGVDESMIILGSSRRIDSRKAFFRGVALHSDKINIGFCLHGGLGDCIIAKKVITSCLEMTTVERCYIDVLCDKDKEEYLHVLFSDTPVHVRPYPSNLSKNLARYDLALTVSAYIRFEQFNYSRILDKDKNFAALMKKLHSIVSNYLAFEHGYEYGIHYARCKLMGYNAYTAYNLGDVFQIKDTRIHIPLAEGFQSRLSELCLPFRYITVNYGWSHSDVITKPHCKVWPIKHYEKFIALFHASYPGVGIVQLGQVHSPYMQGVDRYIFGEHIEVVKYILKSAVFHLDCEGGLVHIATQLGTKCVVLFGPTPVHYFGYKENLNIVSESCQNCCWLDNDFRKCIRGMEEPICMASIRPERVMKEISSLNEVSSLQANKAKIRKN